MKAIPFAATLAVFLLCAVVSAQNYHIRVTNNSRLRAGYSLESKVVETAPAGSVLNVVGQFNRWLKINRRGRDLWLADWISYTRVDSANSPVAQPQPAEVDNCCFVDRQCVSGADWVSGYWAFQQNECPAPPTSKSSPATTSSPLSLPANADNCCQASGAACASNEDWIRGYLAFQIGQCKHPAVVIEGAPAFVARVEVALDMLKNSAPDWYAYTINELKHIVESNESERGVYTKLRSFSLASSLTKSRDDAEVESDVVWLAGVLVHEACHVYRDKAGLEPGGLVGERACLQVQITALQQVDPRARFMNYLSRLLTNIEKEEYQWWH